MEQNINEEQKFDFNEFEVKYLSLDVGTTKKVVLSKWRKELKTFKEDQENPRMCLVFDVIKIDDVEYTLKPLEYSTSSHKLVGMFKPFIERAEAKGEIAIVGMLTRQDKTTYLFTE